MLFDDVKLQPRKGWFQSLKCLITEDFFTPAASVFLRAAEKITNEQELRMMILFTNDDF
jgi:hypothetical protein